MSNAHSPAQHVPHFTLGDRLRKSRESADMTIVDIAKILGVSEKTVRNYEHETTPMKRHALISWALATGVPLVWLETGHAPSDPTDVTYWRRPRRGYPPTVMELTPLTPLQKAS